VKTKGERSKARLLAATATLLQKQGYHATGLSQIVAESGAPRGSVYFYFPGGKEEMACAALADGGAEWRRRLEAVVEAAPDLRSAVIAVCRELGDGLAASGWERGCPMATVALEAATSSDAVRETCARHFADWEQAIADRLVGAGVDRARAAELAVLALSTIEGALMLSKIERSTRPLEVAGQSLAAMLAMIVR
jgi:TetR/AcrR family transcriptional repressor of lmrAB and yxaGH operons